MLSEIDYLRPEWCWFPVWFLATAAHIRSCCCKLVLSHVKNYPKILMNWVIKTKIRSSGRIFCFSLFIYTSLYKFLFCLPFTACSKHSRTWPFLPRSILLSSLKSQETFTFKKYFLVQLEQLTGSNQNTSVWFLCAVAFSATAILLKRRNKTICPGVVLCRETL